MKTFDIIMINMSGYAEWERGVSNRNYHVLKELVHSSKVNKILAVDYPPLTFKRALRNHKENIVPTLREGKVIARSLYDKLTKMSDKLFVYSNSEFWIRPQHFVKRMKAIAIKLHFGDFLLWSYFPPIMEYVRSMGQKLTIFDAVDNWAEHSSYQDMKERLTRNYQFIKANADLVFTVSEGLLKLFDHQSNTYWIPNGVDLAHYQKEHILINRDIADLQKPVVGYIGVIEDRVDVDLIAFLATKNPTKSFVLIGPVWRDDYAQRLKERPNVHLLGYKSYEEAPAYLQQFDVGLIPHRGPFVTATNPMKMYEYLACGLPVVATKNSGVEMFKGHVYIAADPEDFNRKLYRALTEDTVERKNQRKKAVEEFSWNRTVKQMLDIISKKLG